MGLFIARLKQDIKHIHVSKTEAYSRLLIDSNGMPSIQNESDKQVIAISGLDEIEYLEELIVSRYALHLT